MPANGTANNSFSKMVLQKEELEQKHIHLVQIVESEKTAKWQYSQQCEELTVEIKKLRAEASCVCCIHSFSSFHPTLYSTVTSMTSI